MKPMFDHFLFGGDWNPEQWPEDTWEHDLDMLEDAHINEVTINVFPWALLQPAKTVTISACSTRSSHCWSSMISTS